MVFKLMHSFRRCTAAGLLIIHSVGITTPVFAIGSKFIQHSKRNNSALIYRTNTLVDRFKQDETGFVKPATIQHNKLSPFDGHISKTKKEFSDQRILGIGGPSQPEMSSFKSTEANNMVNLFTGDFSYNIPLMDVGGYPVNIFYDGNVSMEQEASWVGLGWNINPGTINRNMRGIPDDFSGEELLEQTQVMKPNITWGARFGADYEFIGYKAMPSVGADLGVSINNYLGPSIELGIKGTVNLSLAKNASSEKSASLNLGLGLNASSRGGLTISPNASLSANAFATDKGASAGLGLGLSTSYNSRSGIKELQINEQMSFNRGSTKENSDVRGMNYANRHNSLSPSLTSTSISFAKPSYIPSLRMPITNSSFSGHFQFGEAFLGNYGSGEIEIYKQKSEVSEKDITVSKPMIGYLYYQNAVNSDNAVMDFTRLNDNEVTVKTPVISAPQYSYDVFSIQGEGTGGSIRAFRNDMGYVRDNVTTSKDKNFSFGADVGWPGHVGANFNMITTPTTIGEWKDNNKLRQYGVLFQDRQTIMNDENVYFRNPGENSVLNKDQYNKIGGDNLVRFKLGNNSKQPSIETVLERFDQSGSKIIGGDVDLTSTPNVTERKKRTQVISFLTAQEASIIGLDKTIKSYNGNWGPDSRGVDNVLQFDNIDRVDNMRGSKHISQINITEANGRRYIYGIPVYNKTQQDFTFSVNANELTSDEDKVQFNPNDPTEKSGQVQSNSETDGYVQKTTTPAYAHSFLLSGLLSNDYVDVTGDGITEDDLGSAVKFNYSKIDGYHKWRTPSSGLDNIANFNPGKLTEKKDNKGFISYGERESWYLHSIESKTMIALFKLESRHDGKGASGPFSKVNSGDDTQKLLRRIDLYSKADLNKNGITGARPIKTVNFDYEYSLCKNTPDNTFAPNEGKLTLKRIYFTYNGQARSNKNQYVFGYENLDGTGNPTYQFNASDRWGTYKSKNDNPTPQFKNALFPYSTQVKTTADQNAGAWSLKKILLPSGGQIEVTYESDDYAFVQNKRAANMIQIAGFSNINNPASLSSNLYERDYLDNHVTENNYVFIKVPEPLSSSVENARNKYLSGVKQLCFKLAVNMPKGIEYVTCYADLDDVDPSPNFGIYNETTAWVRIKTVDDISPLSLTAIEYLREQLPGQAYAAYDISDNTTLEQVGKMFIGLFTGIRDAFANPLQSLRLNDGKAQTVDISKSFVRLNNPWGLKLGGGQRVKSIKLKDNWKSMTNQYTSEYGQLYDYTTTEVFNGVSRKISSGVASYEPSLGGEENPFHTIVSVANKLPLGPSSYGAIEMPVLDAFFPAPTVGYSRVTVKSSPKSNTANKSLSGIGRQVTEFYTAKDFPVYYSYTSLDPQSDIQEHQSSFGAFLYKSAFDSRALSQGFLIATNDMHGKMKSQTSYPENDDKTPISYTENFYRNTGVEGTKEKFNFVTSAGGTISEGNMGIDIELMTDTREFSNNSKSLEIQAQVDLFSFIPPIWMPFIWPVVGKTENTYRAVTTTKTISYHSIVDSVVVIDKGSQVSTKNLVYDAETGDVIVNRTNNEFNQPIYNVNYPAWWAYSGMGLAYKNIDAVYKGNFRDGVISGVPSSAFESGDELYLIDQGTPSTDPCASSFNLNGTDKLWAFDKNKNTSSLTDPNPIFVFMDASGRLYSRDNVTFRIIRSGKRDILDAKAASISTMISPIAIVTAATSTSSEVRKLKIDLVNNTANRTVDAGVTEYKEKWQTDNNTINKYSLVNLPAGSNLLINGNFENGNTSTGSEYLYTLMQGNGGTDEGKYTINTNPKNWNSGFGLCTDHTSVNGKMMIVNGSTQAGVKVWNQTVIVKPYTDYDFSGWYESVGSQSPAKLNFYVNSLQIGSTQVLSSTSCTWKNFNRIWNSGNNTSATISIININTDATGNDFALDDLYFVTYTSCTPSEVADCNGYLEKSINPYRKGMLGSFKAFQSKVFYDARQQTNPSTATNISKDGYLNNFKLYWDFNAANNLVPDESSKQWVFQSQVTKINAKGLELETKDANDTYTAAQYGYNKTVPVAIGNNTKYNEMFAESFEDNSYNEALSGVMPVTCTDTKFIDFSKMSPDDGSSIIYTTTVPGLSAHSGKYVLGVNANRIVKKQIAVKQSEPDPYFLGFGTGTVTSLNDVGVNFTQSLNVNTTWDKVPLLSYESPPSITITDRPSSSFHRYTFDFDAYIQIEKSGTYDFDMSRPPGDGTANDEISFTIDIKDINGISKNSSVLSTVNTPNVTMESYTVNLCKGIYHIVGSVFHTYSNSVATHTNPDETYIWKYKNTTSNTNNTSKVYKNLTSIVESCTYTKPIAAIADMLNPIFTIPSGKKMIFSAWIKENCSSSQCSKVKFDFKDANGLTVTSSEPVNPLTASGPIIEGWQRFEGTFTAPAGSVTTDLSFENNGSDPVYFDDIRMQPYNANLKSYVYDPVSLRLAAELDANNYATFYEYDEEGTLIRTKVETKEGIKTITETRSAKQRTITDFQ